MLHVSKSAIQASEELRLKCLNVFPDQLHGFGPTLAHGSPLFMDSIFPVETLRSWMIASRSAVVPRAKRLKRPYQPRYNRDCYGGLIQIDGSHAMTGLKDALLSAVCWYLSMMPLGKITAFAALSSRNQHLTIGFQHVCMFEQHGKPLAFYSDNIQSSG